MSSNIPVSSVERTASHPAWTPVSVDGTAVTGAVAGGVQPFGIGVADKDVGGNTFLGDSGQMIMISGYNTADDIRDHTGDGDSAEQMRSVNYEKPGGRKLSFVAASGMGVDGEVPPDGVPGSHEAPDDASWIRTPPGSRSRNSFSSGTSATPSSRRAS